MPKRMLGIEINTKLDKILSNKPYEVELGVDWMEVYLRDDIYHKVDHIVMNPPFTKAQDIAHVTAAFDALAPGGRVCSIMSRGWQHKTDRKSQEFRELVEAHGKVAIEYEAGQFYERGTMVPTCLVVLDKPTDQEVAKELEDVFSIL